VFVTFNAWLYQGYDDARAALMDVIAMHYNAKPESEDGHRQDKGVPQARAMDPRREAWRGDSRD